MKRLVQSLVVFAAVVAIPQAATATTITADYSIQFSNGTSPGGTAPWLRASLNDTTSTSGVGVRLTLDALDLLAGEFVSEWWFNVNPAINPAQLSFTVVDLTDVGGLFTPTSGTDCCNADGGGRYDISLAFPTSSAIPANRFTNGDSVEIEINWSGGTLLATDFVFPATPQGGSGPFFTAAHIQGIDADPPSTFVAPGPAGFVEPLLIVTPEPTSLVLLGTGLALVARRLRRSR